MNQSAALASAKSSDSLLHSLTILVLITLMAFPRSFFLERLLLLFAYTLFIAIKLLTTKRRIKIHHGGLLFYTCIAAIGCFWSLIGHLNGSPLDAITDSLRLYAAWSIAYAFLIHSIINFGGLEAVHKSIVIAGIFIPLLNFIGIADVYFQLGIISENLRNELDMKIGFHDGYTQVTSHNIGMLFLIAPYLITYALHKTPSKLWRTASLIALLLSLIMSAASGRRALWLVILMQPLLITGLSIFAKASIKSTRRFFSTSIKISLALLIITIFLVTSEDELFNSKYLIDHISNAFSSDDERSIQAPYLIKGFLESPFFGSGFGSSAGYTRNLERPWIYELTYHQLFYNIGIIGAFIFGCLLLYFTQISISLISSVKHQQEVRFALLIGFASFCIGAYSNPYFGSFDFLLVLAILPLISYKWGIN